LLEGIEPAAFLQTGSRTIPLFHSPLPSPQPECLTQLETTK
jgi:hypothetical protein